MPGRGRGTRSQAAGPGSDSKPVDAKSEPSDQSRGDTKPEVGDDKFSGGTKGRGRGAQAAAPGGMPSDEMVEQMKQSLAKQTEQQLQQQPSKSRSTGGMQPQDAPVASSAFNPNAVPFVPSCKYDTVSQATTNLNVNAKAFVPRFAIADGVPVGAAGEEEEVQQYEGGPEEPVLFDDTVDPYTVPDIMAGFVGGLDEQGVTLLKTGAEILVNCTQYPATFDRLQHKLRNLVEACLRSPSALSSQGLNKLCEMVIIWGLRLPDFRIMASKICEMLFKQDDVRPILLPCLKMSAPKLAVATNVEELQLQIAYTMFCAELFSRTMIAENPFWILGAAICDWLEVLLKTYREDAIYTVCNTLKLTGAILLRATQTDVLVPARKVAGKLPMLMDNLKMLTISGKLSRQCVEVIKRVLSLYNQGWGQPTSPDASLRENPLQVESKYDTASDTSDIPVTNPGEWDEYTGPEHGLEHPSLMAGHSEHQASIDSDVEEEFEQFIEEIEDFLMKQDMGEPLDEEER